MTDGDRRTLGERMLEACMLENFAEAAALLPRLQRATAAYRTFDAAMAVMGLRRGLTDMPAARAKLRAAQDEPPDDPRMLVLLFIAAVKHAVMIPGTDAPALMRTLKSLAAEQNDPAVEMQVLLCEAQTAWSHSEFKKTHEFLVRAIEIPVPTGSGLWFGVRMAACVSGMQSDDLPLVRRALGEMESQAAPDEHIRDEVFLRRLRMLSASGRSDEGLALLAGREKPKSPDARIRFVHYHSRLLANAGRYDEAMEVVERDARAKELPFHDFLRARICQLRGDVDGVRERVRRALGAAPASSNFLFDCSVLLAGAELQGRRPKVARRLLRMIDPDQQDGGAAVLWAWLLLQEGDSRGAARQFRRVMDVGDREVFRETLRFCAGMTSAEMAVLWSLADEQRAGTTADANTDQAQPKRDAAAAAPAQPPAAQSAPEPTKPPAAPAQRPRESAAESGRAVLLGESPAIVAVRANIERFAPLGETVLVSGQTGTGKELVARLLHDQSPRAAEPFIAVNCGGISETLIESELFGHVKGAFTGATADHDGIFLAAGRGTVFLDEITSMSPRLQATLLRVLENGEVRPVGASHAKKIQARVIAASNQPLAALAEKGEFRADLYYRLARLHIQLPPLAERREDIPRLARHFLGRFYEYGEVTIEDELLRRLSRHDWPGNVRELENEIRRMAVLAAGKKSLEASLFSAAGSRRLPTGPARGHISLAPTIHDKVKLLRRLFEERGELTRAEVVELLGCSPNTATSYLKRLEKEGQIERVNTSGSLRTSYFQLRTEEGSGRGDLNHQGTKAAGRTTVS